MVAAFFQGYNSDAKNEITTFGEVFQLRRNLTVQEAWFAWKEGKYTGLCASKTQFYLVWRYKWKDPFLVNYVENYLIYIYFV